MWMTDEFPLPHYIFLILFPALWSLVLFILSTKSGWSRVAQTYLFNGKIKGKYYRFQSARISGVGFRSSLEVGISDDGLLLVPLLPFRPFHRRILIPWKDLKVERFRRLFFSGYKLSLTEDDRFTITIGAKLFNRMHDKITSTTEHTNKTPQTKAARRSD